MCSFLLFIFKKKWTVRNWSIWHAEPTRFQRNKRPNWTQKKKEQQQKTQT